MEFDEVMSKRRSVRSFTGRKPDWRSILLAIDMANKGSFAGNINNFKCILIENEKVIEHISRICQQLWIAESGFIIIVCSDEQKLEDEYGERGRLYAKQQAGAYTNNVILKLIDLGLSTCWVGAFAEEEVRDLLFIPKNIQIEAIIPVGFEKKTLQDSGKKRKVDLQNVLFWERWNVSKREPHFSEAPMHRDPWT